MRHHLIGHWEATSSTIPDYQPRTEWLTFSEDGGTWAVTQPDGSGRKNETLFHFEEIENGIHLTPFNKITGNPTKGWPLRIEILNPNEIAVTPRHGFSTIFHRIESSSVFPANARAKVPRLSEA